MSMKVIHEFPRSSSMCLLHTGQTISKALDLCGINEGNDIQNQMTAAERFANDVFGNSWITFIDISFEELDEHYKTYASLRKELGKIVIRV